MITINGTVEGQRFTLDNKIVATGMNVGQIKFTFSSDWNDYKKTAVFFKDTSKVYRTEVDDNGIAKIPPEAIQDKGICYIGVFGAYGENVLTSEVIGYYFRLGAISKDLTPSDPTPDVYDQLLGRYSTLEKRVAALEKELAELKQTLKV
jgi:hypothetical protein|nr:MAG TPA: DNA repair protein [Caudoviricetes sp.]